MEKKRFTNNSNNAMKEDSSQHDQNDYKHKPKIFLIKKIKANSFLFSPYLRPFLLLPRNVNISNTNDANKNVNNLNNLYYLNKLNNLNTNNSVDNIDNILNLFDLNKIISEIINNQRNDINLSFHQKYNYFRKSLYIIPLERKTEIDCILKKCKAKFSKAFYEILCKLLKKRNIKYKLPQNFVNNINIAYNRKYLNCSMLQIFKDCNIFVDIDKIKIQLTVNKFKLFLYVINKSYKEMFQEYINSKKYLDDCSKIDNRAGIKFGLLFRYVSKIFINYYLSGKAYKKN